MNPRLITLYASMSALTAPECERVCRVPHSCCSPEYCDLAEEWAASKGVKLTVTGHPKLKFMGDGGCIVPPHLRPLCTLHTCAVNSVGAKASDPEWNDEYFALRGAIEEIEN